MNFDFAKNTPIIAELKTMLHSYGLQIISNFFTRITNDTQTQIDIIMTNRPTNFYCQTEEANRISDHETISVNFKTDLTLNKTNDSFLSWKNYNNESLVENLRNENWQNFETLSIDEKIELIRTNLLSAVDPMVTTIKIKEKEMKLNWFDNELKNMKEEKIELYNLWKSGKTVLTWASYKNKLNDYNKLIKSKKNEAIKNEIVRSSHDQKQMWKSLNKILPTKRQNVCDEIIFDECQSTENEIICEKFNCFFVDSIIEINSQIPYTELDELYPRNDNNFKFKEVSIEQVKEASKYLTKKVNKSQFCNSVVWYDAIDYIGHFLTSTINESLKTGIIPKKWKISTVTPIPKIVNTNIASNFRPINEMPVDEKICECLVKDQLLKYINDNDLLAENQSAFRANHSCETALNSLVSDWLISREKGDTIVVVFLDLKRAFETVDREIMLEKLENIGINGIELKWFTNFLSSRKQCTKFKGAISKELEVPIGLPQGTQLSVYLFLLYINDLVYVPDLGEIVLFADDTGLIVKHKNAEMAVEIANRELKKIEYWLNSNKLKLHTGKCTWMLIGKENENNSNEFTIQIDNKIIKRVQNIKYLGFEIDDKMDFKAQISTLTKKLASKINVLYRISDKITFDLRKMVYNAIIQPHYDYCSTLYINCEKQQIDQMQKLQNRAMRYILKCDYRTSQDFMLKTLNWMSVSQRIKYNVLILVFKMKNNIVPNYLENKIRYTNEFHDFGTRSRTRNVIRLPDLRSESARNCLLYKGVKMYIELPNEIKNILSTNVFKKRLAMHIKGQ